MKALKTLIRLKKDEIDILKKELVQIEERQQLVITERNNLTIEMAKEADLASEFPEMAISFASYTRKSLDRQKTLQKNIDILQQAVDKKREELVVEFGELKKYEIALEQKQFAQFQEEKRRESIKMDEVALRGFSRKSE